MNTPLPRADEVTTWTVSDAEALATFLSTDVGRRLLTRVASAKPGESVRRADNSAKLTLGRMLQHDAILGIIVGLADPASAENRVEPGTTRGEVNTGSPNYPDLDNDELWSPELGGKVRAAAPGATLPQ